MRARPDAPHRCFRCRWNRRCAPPTKSSSCFRSPPASATRPAGSCSTTSAPWSCGAARRSRARPTTSSPRSAGFSAARATELPRSKLAEVLQTGRPIRDEEVTVERADGTEIAVLLNIDPLFNPQGKLVGAINCFQDVTERKRMVDALDRSQHDLREQEERWTATYEHAAIGIVELDAEGRFLRVNEAICSIVGGTREELLGWRLFGRTHPDDRDVDEELYRRQVAGDIGFYSIEKRFIRKDGRRDLDRGALIDRARCHRAFSLRRAGGAGHHRAQGGRGAPEAADRRAQPSRQEHAGDGAIAGDPDRARHGFARSVPQGLRGPPDRAQPGARSAHAPSLEERGPARHRRGRHRAASRRARTEADRSRSRASRSR